MIDGAGGLAHRAAQILGDDSDWQRTRTELDRWNHSAGRLREQLERALEVNTAPIAERDELRGLLRAYRAKATMVPGLADAVVELGQAAHDELYTRPTDIVRAKRLIDEFASALNR